MSKGVKWTKIILETFFEESGLNDRIELGDEKARLMVVGPNRMQYDRILGLLDYISQEIEKFYK